MLRKDSIDFGFISSHAASRVTRKAFVSYIEIPVQIPRCLSQSSLGSFHTRWIGREIVAERNRGVAFKA